MNFTALGNSIYAAVRSDPKACATIKSELSTLALALLTDPNASARITSATVNGQTFSTTAAMTNAQRMSLLRHVVACIDRGGPISATSLTTF